LAKTRSPQARTSGRYAAKLAISMATFAVILLLAEMGARLLERPERPAGVSGDATMLDPLQDIRAPHVEGVLVGKSFRTNSLGFRGPEYGSPPPAGTLRIAITGDSVTMGWGVAEDEAYPALLEAQLNAIDDSARHEVVNLGIAGAAIEEAMDRLALADVAYSPDLLIYGFTANDIEGKSYRYLGGKIARVGLVVEKLRYRDSRFALLRLLWPRWIELRERWSPSVPPYVDEIHFNYFENEEAWRHFRSQLGRFAEMGQKNDRCTHLLIHTDLASTDRDDLPYRAVYDRISKAALELGISVTDSTSAHEGLRYAGVRIGGGDSHPNERGHILLAEALARDVVALPPRCRAHP
jgi:hypothetical protein